MKFRWLDLISHEFLRGCHEWEPQAKDLEHLHACSFAAEHSTYHYKVMDDWFFPTPIMQEHRDKEGHGIINHFLSIHQIWSSLRVVYKRGMEYECKDWQYG